MWVVGWGNTPTEPSFGGSRDDAASVKGKIVNLISSVRTLMRSEFLVPLISTKANGLLTVPLIVINTLVIVYELVLG